MKKKCAEHSDDFLHFLKRALVGCDNHTQKMVQNGPYHHIKFQKNSQCGFREQSEQTFWTQIFVECPIFGLIRVFYKYLLSSHLCTHTALSSNKISKKLIEQIPRTKRTRFLVQIGANPVLGLIRIFSKYSLMSLLFTYRAV